jgi:signal transduction histidine kinase
VLGFYAWLRRHPLLVDGLLALAVAAAGLGASPRPPHERLLTTIPFSLAMALPVMFRRQYPGAAFAAVVAVGAAQVAVLSWPLGSDFSVLILLYTLAASRPRRLSVAGLAVCLLGSVVALVRWEAARVTHADFMLGTLAALFVGPALLAWLLGDSMKWRRGFYLALEERAARLECERDAQALLAAATERARIARELHDVVAHSVSVMVVQADGAAFALDSAPQQVRAALGAISGTGRQALTEMRGLLGVLREAGQEPAELAPQPGLDQLADLLEHSRSAGLPVSFAVEGAPCPLPPGTALAAYRVVQESLTNTRKHGGPGVRAEVTLRFGPDGLDIRVADNGRGGAAGGDGAGHGLLGMRQRVELHGGTVGAGPAAGGGYRVTARLPLPAAADAASGAAR